MSGKWHAGHSIVRQQPHGVGFDRSLGYMNGACDHYTQEDREDGCSNSPKGSKTKKPPTVDIWDTDRPGYGLNGTYGDYMYVGRAVETIVQHNASAAPLFYYLAMQCAHAPMEAPDRFKDLYDKKTTPNVIEYAFSSVIDEGLANVTRALKTKGMWDNTLLVVSSDNGGPAFIDQHAVMHPHAFAETIHTCSPVHLPTCHPSIDIPMRTQTYLSKCPFPSYTYTRPPTIRCAAASTSCGRVASAPTPSSRGGCSQPPCGGVTSPRPSTCATGTPPSLAWRG